MEQPSFLSVPNTPRLHFKLMDTGCRQQLFELDQFPEVMKYISGKVTSMEDIDDIFIPRMLAYRNPEKGWGIWQVNLTESDEYIGWVLVRPMHFFGSSPELDNLEFGWRFKPSSWGKGFATEAARAVMKTLADERGCRHFSAIADPENKASINIMKKLGMKFLKQGLHKDPLGDSVVVYYEVNVES